MVETLVPAATLGICIMAVIPLTTGRWLVPSRLAPVPETVTKPLEERWQRESMPFLDLRRDEADAGEEPKASEDCDVVRDVRVGRPTFGDTRSIERPEVLVVDPDGDLVEPAPQLAAQVSRAARRVPWTREGCEPAQVLVGHRLAGADSHLGGVQLLDRYAYQRTWRREGTDDRSDEWHRSRCGARGCVRHQTNPLSLEA